jgi:hypothetical protein
MVKRPGPFTVMLWINKHELRVIDPNYAWRPGQAKEFRYLPEHEDDPPRFDSAEAGWAFIRDNYPELQP